MLFQMNKNFAKHFTKRKVLAALIVVGLASFLLFNKTKALPSQSGAYFDSISIAKWTSIKSPCVPIQIGHKTISAQIDLGFKGQCSLDSSVLEQIEEKTLLGSQTMYGFQGTPYDKKVFQVQSIRIGDLSLNNPQVQEEGKNFYAQAVVSKNGGKPAPPEPARIGWKAFQNTNLLLDLKNDKIAFCDSLATLKKQGYATQKFMKTHLFIDRGLVEIDAIVNNKPFRCMLDTGSTFNVLNVKNEENKSLQELFWNPETFRTMDAFKISQKEFGPITFRQLPIRLPIHIDAILGMDFFLENLVFIDFDNSLVYFCPYAQMK
jgi:hypothetical protein